MTEGKSFSQRKKISVEHLGIELFLHKMVKDISLIDFFKKRAYNTELIIKSHVLSVWQAHFFSMMQAMPYSIQSFLCPSIFTILMKGLENGAQKLFSTAFCLEYAFIPCSIVLTFFVLFLCQNNCKILCYTD